MLANARFFPANLPAADFLIYGEPCPDRPDGLTLAEREDELPIDQHKIIALIARGAVHVGSASEDGRIRVANSERPHADPVTDCTAASGLE